MFEHTHYVLIEKHAHTLAPSRVHSSRTEENHECAGKYNIYFYLLFSDEIGGYSGFDGISGRRVAAELVIYLPLLNIHHPHQIPSHNNYPSQQQQHVMVNSFFTLELPNLER
jgi:hypothetical protein